MNIPKAIEILALNVRETGRKMPPDVKDALNLGIEALSFIEKGRKGIYIPIQKLLPSETAEADSL